MDGCSGFPPDSQTASIKQYSVGLRTVTARAIRAEGGIRTQTVTAKKLQQPHTRAAAAVFPQQKTTGSVLADPSVFPHLSSSSDLRILSSTQPSQVTPMTDFRQVWCLHAYSGGTVRDSHPVFYSPAVLLPHPQALKRNIYLRIYDTRFLLDCQSKKGKSVDFDTKRNIIPPKRKIVGSSVHLDNPLVRLVY